jgi:hypothetical protein
VGREVRTLRQAEVIDEDELVTVVAGQNEIGAGLLEMRAEEKLGVADFNMIRRRPFRQIDPTHARLFSRMVGTLGVKTAQHLKAFEPLNCERIESKSRKESPEVGIVVIPVFSDRIRDCPPRV